MAVVLESITTIDYNSLSNSITVNMPVTRPDGDLYVLFLGKDDNQEGITFTGWTQLDYRADAGTHSGYIFYRIGSSEPASYTSSTWVDNEPAGGCVARFSGAGTPISQAANGNSASATAPAIAGAAATSMMVRMWAIEDDNPGNNPPTGHTTQEFDHFGNGVDRDVFMAIATDGTLGATDAAVWGGSYGNNWVAFTLEIPVAPGAVPVVESVTHTDGGGNTVGITFNMPGTRPDGDLYLAFITKDEASGSPEEPTLAGWTKLEYLTSSGGTPTHSGILFYRVGSSEPATYATGGETGSEYHKVAVIRVSGAGTPTHSGARGNVTAATAPAIPGAAATSLILRLWSINDDDPGTNPPSGHTEWLYDGGNPTNHEPMIAVAESDTPGDTSAATYGGTYSDNATFWTVEVPSASGGIVFADVVPNIQAGIVFDKNEATGGNARLAADALFPQANIVRTDDNTLTITGVTDATYDITVDEEGTITIPGIALKSGLPLVVTPTFLISATPNVAQWLAFRRSRR